ncbi:helix-turn-helix domain-containing protein [Ruegeria sp. PrR005]|uniref:Helix-turn-helix domain-containing protein n=1 Tax=Ruegeria sp. PrR005 TaxID=2706882 RepID=A0A6B2NNJ7_9RHOB|nr:helix-turn-helix domain-containing protein [Ruegeria sp. PrR005]NDW45692.1 helix-turn-helix domain-containing protein [Ruegeria sp. PrR005]
MPETLIEHAKIEQPEAYRGRKSSYDRDQLNLVLDMTNTGAGTSEVARAAGLSRQTVLRIRRDLAEAEAGLARWGM